MADVIRVVRQAGRAIVYGLTLSIIMPLLLGYALGISTGDILALVGWTLVLQANGVFVGLGLGMEPLVVLAVMIFVELGAVLAIYEILRAFEESRRVQRFIDKAEAAIRKYPKLSRHGAVTLLVLPAMPIVGLYSSVPIGWLFRWKKSHCILFITLGWILIVVSLMVLTLGIIPAII